MTECMQWQHTQPTKDTTNHNTFHNNNPQTQLTTHPHRTPTIPMDDRDDYDGRALLSRRCRCGTSLPGTTINVAVLPLPCCRRRRPTSGSGPRSEGGSTANRKRKDRGFAAAVTVALAQWANPPTRGARAGAALDASDQ